MVLTGFTAAETSPISIIGMWTPQVQLSYRHREGVTFRVYAAKQSVPIFHRWRLKPRVRVGALTRRSSLSLEGPQPMLVGTRCPGFLGAGTWKWFESSRLSVEKLCLACHDGNIKETELHLSRRAYANGIDEAGMTPLLYAIHVCHTEG